MKVISKVYASFAQSVLSLGGNVNTRVNNSCLQISSGDTWFQYVRRVYATAIDFPCIITLNLIKE